MSDPSMLPPSPIPVQMPQPTPAPSPAARSTNVMAILSLLFGLSSWIILPFLGAVVAVVLGHMARSEIRRAPPGTQEGDGLAVGGLIMGYAQLVLLALGLLVAVVVILCLFAGAR